MFNGSFCSNTHHFRDNTVFLEAENDVIEISPLGGAVYSFVMMDSERSTPLSYFCSNTHHFRDIKVFLENGNDIIAVSPLGGVVYSFC